MIDVAKYGTMALELVRACTDYIRSEEMIVIRNACGHYYVDLGNSWSWTEDRALATRYHNIRSAETTMKVHSRPFLDEGAKVTELEIV